MTSIQSQILSDIATNGGTWTFYAIKYGDKAKVNKELDGLIKMGLVSKKVERIKFLGKFSTKITLSQVYSKI